MHQRPHGAVLAAWALLAAANLSAGIVLASLPSRRADLDTIRRWGGAWLLDRSNVYAVELADYPPHALVVLSPLSVLPEWAAVTFWAALNVALAVWAGYLTVRSHRRGASLAVAILMLLSWGCFRTLLQFSLFAFTFGMVALNVADKRPGLGGLCLGLALMKPQVAAPFVVWALLTRRMRMLVIATATLAAGVAIFCARVPVSPMVVARDYWNTLSFYYFADPVMVGLSELRPLIAAVSSARAADVTAAVASASMLAAIGFLGVRERRSGSDLVFSAPPLAALWSLMTFYHLTYGFVILLPLASALLREHDRHAARLSALTFWCLQIAMMVDIPGLSRQIDPLLGAPGLGTLARHVDRLIMIVLCVLTWIVAERTLSGPGDYQLRARSEVP